MNMKDIIVSRIVQGLAAKVILFINKVENSNPNPKNHYFCGAKIRT